MSTAFTPWLYRTVLGGLLLLAYLLAWTPVRTAWVQYGAGPILSASASASTSVTVRPSTHTVAIQPASTTGVTVPAPAGVKFLLAAGALILLFPGRAPVGLFFLGHLFLGGLTLGLAAGALLGLPGGLHLAHFAQTYLVDTYSLGLPVLLFARNRSARLFNRQT